MNKKNILYSWMAIMFLFTSYSKPKDFSKSSNYYYEVTDNDKFYYVRIFSKDNSCVFINNEEYRKFDRFYICWDDNLDKLWIWSSDIGLFTIEKNDTWTKQKVSLSNTPKSTIPTRMIDNVPFLQRYYNNK